MIANTFTRENWAYSAVDSILLISYTPSNDVLEELRNFAVKIFLLSQFIHFYPFLYRARERLSKGKYKLFLRMKWISKIWTVTYASQFNPYTLYIVPSKGAY